MKLKVITYSSREDYGLRELERSLKAGGYDYEVLKGEWKGFGTKLIATYLYLKEIKLQGYTHFLFVDAYDSFLLGEIISLERRYQSYFNDPTCLVCSVEKGCWPDASLAEKYPECLTPWKYLNSGGYMGSIDTYIKMFEENIPEFETDDQDWFHHRFLSGKYNIKLDIECCIFQSIAFEEPKDFEWLFDEGAIVNMITMQDPIVIHGNGKTPMQEVYELWQTKIYE